MVRVGRHAADAEQDERLERAHVLGRVPKLVHVVVSGLDAALARDGVTLGVDAVSECADGRGLEVDVGHAGEQAVEHEVGHAPGGRLVAERAGEANERAGELVLLARRERRLAAHARARAAAAASRLFALEAEHLAGLGGHRLENPLVSDGALATRDGTTRTHLVLGHVSPLLAGAPAPRSVRSPPRLSRRGCPRVLVCRAEERL